MSKPMTEQEQRIVGGYVHPATIQEFEAVYRDEYEQELRSCDSWIKWCEKQNDTHGTNFHQGRRSALVFNNIKMEQLLRVLKQEAPNAPRRFCAR
jgi:hypothetical protein